MGIRFDSGAPHVADILGRTATMPPFVHLQRVEQAPEPIDIAGVVRDAVAQATAGILPGARIAIAVGSRGISELVSIVRECVAAVRAAGGEPFIVPAMGSHGGATAEGQQAMLAHLGVDEQSCGAPVLATMDVVDLGEVEPDLHAHLDANAAGSDGIIVVNRIKSHTSFTGDIESGIAKMVGIGLGKQQGAEQVHKIGPNHVERRLIACCRRVVETGLILGGIAIIEDARHHVRSITFVAPADIGGPVESGLLDRAKELEARLPVEAIDVLIIDKLGKDKSGTGIDTNVIGRRMIRGETEPARPRIVNIVVLGITEVSDGNATGIGLADFVPVQVAEQIDLIATYMNSLTAGLQGVQRAQLPIVLATDRDAIEGAVLTANIVDPDQARVVRVHDTLTLDDVMVTPALEAEFTASGFTRVSDDPSSCIAFSEDGQISGW